jgi:hypothetical protein
LNADDSPDRHNKAKTIVIYVQKHIYTTTWIIQPNYERDEITKLKEDITSQKCWLECIRSYYKLAHKHNYNFPNYLFMVHLQMQLVSEITLVGWSVNDQFERVWNEAIKV